MSKIRTPCGLVPFRQTKRMSARCVCRGMIRSVMRIYHCDNLDAISILQKAFSNE